LSATDFGTSASDSASVAGQGTLIASVCGRVHLGEYPPVSVPDDFEPFPPEAAGLIVVDGPAKLAPQGLKRYGISPEDVPNVVEVR
jgi:hypothetical protein